MSPVKYTSYIICDRSAQYKISTYWAWVFVGLVGCPFVWRGEALLKLGIYLFWFSYWPYDLLSILLVTVRSLTVDGCEHNGGGLFALSKCQCRGFRLSCTTNRFILKRIRRLILLDFYVWYLTGVALPLTISQLDYELEISIA